MITRSCFTWRNHEKQDPQYSWKQDQRCPDRSCSHHRVSAGYGGRKDERDVPIEPSCRAAAHTTQTKSHEGDAGGDSFLQKIAGKIKEVSVETAFD